ncbi:membrane hypothetical protein [Gammaproteobacteria bacterium]
MTFSYTMISRVVFFILAFAIAFPFRMNYSFGPFNTLSFLDVAVIICIIFFIYSWLISAPILLGNMKLAFSIIFPILVAGISIFWAVNQNTSMSSFVKYIYNGLYYFISLNLAKNMSARKIGQIFSFLIIAWIFGSLAMYLDIPGFRYFIAEKIDLKKDELNDIIASYYLRLSHPYIGMSNDYGPILIFFGFLLLGIARYVNNFIFLIVAIFSICFSILTFSRGMILALIFVNIFSNRLFRVTFIKFLTTIAIAVLFSFLFYQTISNISIIHLEDRDRDLSSLFLERISNANIKSRFISSNEDFQLIMDRPFLGYGSGYNKLNSASHNFYIANWKYFGIILGTITSILFISVIIIAFNFQKKYSYSSVSVLYFSLGMGWMFLCLTVLSQTLIEATAPRTIIFYGLGTFAGMLHGLRQSACTPSINMRTLYPKVFS